MISTKPTNKMTPTERKEKVKELKKEHEKFFKAYPDALYIPKMAYRPPGKDELHVSFFPSEFEKEQDVYTEFVSINYDTEDPKRTLYLLHKNLHWKEEYQHGELYGSVKNWWKDGQLWWDRQYKKGKLVKKIQ